MAGLGVEFMRVAGEMCGSQVVASQSVEYTYAW